MYRRPKFLETLLEIRRDMALEADYDVDLFAEMARSGKRPAATSLKAQHEPGDPTDRPGPVKPVRKRRTVLK